MIAIVDDDPSMRDMLVSLVRSVGYGARDFASGEAFLASGDMSQLACVVTDIHMPGISGFDIKQELDKRASRLPVIMITARTDSELADRASSVGAFGFLRKPLDFDMLIELIQKASDHQRD